ncbi:MAG: hypothetical protein Q8P93_04290 [bacterium]|nr:hypothetical protein [bacterium]
MKTIITLSTLTFVFLLVGTQNAVAQEVSVDSVTEADVNTPAARTRIQTQTELRSERIEQAEARSDAKAKERAEAQETRTIRVQEAKANREENREQRRGEIVVKMTQRIEAYLERMLVRFTVAFDRLERIEQRIESRILKLEAEGLATNEARTHLQTAIDARLNAETVLARTDANLEVSASDNLLVATVRDAFGSVRASLKEAKDLILEARAALHASVRAIKAVQPPKGGASAEVDVDAEANVTNQ